MMQTDTSREALARVHPALTLLQLEVLEHVRACGDTGCTDLDIQRHFGNHRSTYRTRRAELVDQELVRDSGRRAVQDGGKRIVWVAA